MNSQVPAWKAPDSTLEAPLNFNSYWYLQLFSVLSRWWRLAYPDSYAYHFPILHFSPHSRVSYSPWRSYCTRRVSQESDVCVLHCREQFTNPIYQNHPFVFNARANWWAAAASARDSSFCSLGFLWFLWRATRIWAGRCRNRSHSRPTCPNRWSENTPRLRRHIPSVRRGRRGRFDRSPSYGC